MIYTNSDGGARGNPGPGAIGFLLENEKRILLMDTMKIGNYITNNVAEYEAL
jgi:ribonuclease HI